MLADALTIVGPYLRPRPDLAPYADRDDRADDRPKQRQAANRNQSRQARDLGYRHADDGADEAAE
jgi:hypothetical protein